jgi:spermidine synthase
MSNSENQPVDGTPVLHRTREALSLQFSGSPSIQSTMSLLNPYALDLEYTRLMMGFLLFNHQPQHILMVGLGGGSIPKFCHRYLAETQIDVVEIDPAVIALRDEFQIPPDDARFTIIEDDGALYLQDELAPVDVLLIDAYDGYGMPESLCDLEFFEDCEAALTDDGMLVVNLHLESETYHVCLAHLRTVFGSSLFEVIDDDMTNSIVYACKGNLFETIDWRTALRKPDALSKDVWRQLSPTFKVIEATLVLR